MHESTNPDPPQPHPGTMWGFVKQPQSNDDKCPHPWGRCQMSKPRQCPTPGAGGLSSYLVGSNKTVVAFGTCNSVFRFTYIIEVLHNLIWGRSKRLSNIKELKNEQDRVEKRSNLKSICSRIVCCQCGTEHWESLCFATPATVSIRVAR